MPLPNEKQIVEMPIVGGLDEKSDALASMKPLRLTNVVERRTGSLSRRYGYELVSDLNLRVGGATSPPALEQLVTREDELVRIGGGEIDTYLPIGATSDWCYRGKVSEAIPRLGAAGQFSNSFELHCDPASVVANGYECLAYTYTGGSAYSVVVELVDEATGARVKTIVLATSATVGNVRLAANGTTLIVFWYDSSVTSIKGATVNLTTLAVGAATVAASGLGSAHYDVDVTGSAWLLIYSSATDAIVRSIDSTFAALATRTVAVYGAIGMTAASVRYNSARIWYAYARSNGGVFQNVVGTLTAALTVDASATVVATPAAGALNIGLDCLSGSRAVCAWTMTSDGAYWHELTYTAGVIAVAALATRYLKDMFLVSRPLARSATQACALFAHAHGSHSSYWLLDLHAQDATVFTAGDAARIIGVALPRQVKAFRSATTWSVFRPRDFGVAPWSLGDKGYYVAAVREKSSALPQDLVWKFDDWTRTTDEANGLLLISGGVVQGFDGARAFELGFPYEPDDLRLAAFTSSNGAGTLTNSAKYGYRFVYAWTDARGNEHRSAPSGVVGVTLGAADDTVAGTVPNLHITNKVSAAIAGSPVDILVFRTTANGRTYFFHSRIANVANTTPTAFTDTTPDTSITSNEELNGAEVASTIPAGGTLVHVWRESVVVADTETGDVWFSKPLVTGDGPGFSGSMTQAPWDGGAVTALADLESTLVVGKAESLWRIDGDPPANNGSSSLTSPVRIPSAAGIATPTGTLRTPEGVVFMSGQGLYILDRGFSVSFLGAGVASSVPPGTVFAGCAVLPAQNLARWVVRESTVAPNLDLFHSRLRQSPQWTVDALRDPAASTAVANVLGACMYRGAFVWFGGEDEGSLYSESTTNFYDTDGATSRLPAMDVEVAYEQASGKQGFQRLFRAALLASKATDVTPTLTLTSDTASNARSWTDTEVSALPDLPNVSLRIGPGTTPGAGRVQWVKLRFQDAAPTVASLGTGEGWTLRSVALEIGLVSGLGRRARAAHK